MSSVLAVKMHFLLQYCLVCHAFQAAFEVVERFEESCKDIRSSETDFANYLCEDVKKFKLEEVLNIFKQFCDNINTAKKARLLKFI